MSIRVYEENFVGEVALGHQSSQEIVNNLYEMPKYKHFQDYYDLKIQYGIPPITYFGRVFDYLIENCKSKMKRVLVEFLHKLKKREKSYNFQHYINYGHFQGRTLLDVCVLNDMPDVVKYLIKMGVDLANINDDGKTALDIAILEDKDEAAHILYLANAKVHFLTTAKIEELSLSRNISSYAVQLC